MSNDLSSVPRSPKRTFKRLYLVQGASVEVVRSAERPESTITGPFRTVQGAALARQKFVDSGEKLSTTQAEKEARRIRSGQEQAA